MLEQYSLIRSFESSTETNGRKCTLSLRKPIKKSLKDSGLETVLAMVLCYVFQIIY